MPQRDKGDRQVDGSGFRGGSQANRGAGGSLGLGGPGGGPGRVGTAVNAAAAPVAHGYFGTALARPARPQGPSMASVFPSGYDPNSRSQAFNTRLNINDPSKMHAVDLSLGDPRTTEHLNELRHIGNMVFGQMLPGYDIAMGIGDAFRTPRTVPSAGPARPGFQNSSVNVPPAAPPQSASWMGRALAALGGLGRPLSMMGALR